MYEDAQWSCAGVESNRDVSCYCHLSMINCPSMSNNSCHNVVGEFCSRLRCNRRYAKPSPVILCAKPAPQFWGKNRGDGFAVWAQARQWWVQQPPGTLTSWHAEAAQVCMSESAKEVAARVGDLVHTSLQPTFDLVKRGHAPGMCQLGNPDLGSPAGSREASRGSTEHSTLDNQGGGSGTWVAPGRRGAYAHACRGAVPLCKQNVAVLRQALRAE